MPAMPHGPGHHAHVLVNVGMDRGHINKNASTQTVHRSTHNQSKEGTGPWRSPQCLIVSLIVPPIYLHCPPPHTPLLHPQVLTQFAQLSLTSSSAPCSSKLISIPQCFRLFLSTVHETRLQEHPWNRRAIRSESENSLY